MNSCSCLLRFFLTRWLPVLGLAFAAAAAMAQAQADPPARVATLSQIEGTVAFAPAGETEWGDAAVNRPITRGDRLWTDPGARAEVHLGSAALHLTSQTFVEVVALDDEVLQLNLNEGAVNARVRQLEGGENFELTTPQLSFRAAQPGDYRVDADPARGYTRVTVRSGLAMVYGAGGGVLQLRAGQQMAFTGRDLAQVAVPAPVEDNFDRWAADRNRSEDQSISARYVPRDVVGYQQLDANGVWSQDPSYGPVWYPTLTVSDWAPYRYGHWEWIVPWGWTWIDDARWGFAPFHYGRWAQIGSRWAWVPGRIGPRPVYSPALVVFVGGAGGGANWNLSIGSGPGIAWFPLAPGEAWRPTYRTSSRYLRDVNRNVVFNGAGNGFFFQRRSEAITAVRVDDFNRGRPVHQHWNRVNGAELGRVQINAQPAMPEPRRWADTARGAQVRSQPAAQQPPAAAALRPQPQWQPSGVERREFRGNSRPDFPRAAESPSPQRPQGEFRRPQPGQAVQQMQERQRDQRDQQLQLRQRQREEATRQHEGAQQQERIRQQQAQQQQQQQQERVQRQQQATQERAQQQQLWQQQRAATQQQSAPPSVRAEGRLREERGSRSGQQRDERADPSQEEGRGRGRGQRVN